MKYNYQSANDGSRSSMEKAYDNIRNVLSMYGLEGLLDDLNIKDSDRKNINSIISQAQRLIEHAYQANDIIESQYLDALRQLRNVKAARVDMNKHRAKLYTRKFLAQEQNSNVAKRAEEAQRNAQDALDRKTSTADRYSMRNIEHYMGPTEIKGEI